MEAGPSQQGTTNPSSRVKRKRVTLACQRCRVKKAKCNGSKPTCSNCETAGELCKWPDPEKDGRKNKSRRVTSEASAERTKESVVGGNISVSQNVQVSGPLHDQYGLLATSIQRFYDGHQSACDPFVSEEAKIHANSPIPSPGRSTQRVHSPSNHLVPRATSIQHSPPSDSSPIDILLAAAALPMNARATTQNPSEPEENPGESSTPPCISESPRRLSYYRSLGPTAVEPVLEKIRIHFSESRPDAYFQDSDSAAPQCHHGHYPAPFTFESNFDVPGDMQNMRLDAEHSPQESLYAPGSNIPRPQYLQKLVPLFFSRMGCHFPFLTEKSLLSPIDNDDSLKRMTTPLLVNAVCALAARFSDSPFLGTVARSNQPATYGIPFADRAKNLLISRLGYPSPNTVAALLFLAYFSFGLNDDGATWMYSGMTLRMAVDLGLHQETDLGPASATDEADRSRNRLLWWSCFVLDRTVAFLMGRPTTLKDKEIKVALPNDADIITVTKGEPEILSLIHKGYPSFPFVYHVKMFRLYGPLAEILNSAKHTCAHSLNDSGPSLASEAPESDSSGRLADLEQSIAATYVSLPEDMKFNPVNLRLHAASSGPVFLELHLWYNAIIILLYRVPLIHTHVIAARVSLTDRLSVVNQTYLTIYNIIASADLVDPSVVLALPFVSQCFFLAAVASIQDSRIREGQSVLASMSKSIFSNPRSENSNLLHPSTGVLGQMAMNSFRLCKGALSRQAPYWLGAKRMDAVVEQYASQKRRFKLNGDVDGVDISMLKSEAVSFGCLLRRLTGLTTLADIHRHILDQMFVGVADANERGPSRYILSGDDKAFAYCFASFTAANSDRS